MDRLDREGQPHFYVGDVKRYNIDAVIAWHRERTARAMSQRSGARTASAATSGAEPGAAGGHGSGVRLLSRRRTG